MRRLFWVGVGVVAGAAGPRWMARTVRRQAPGPSPAGQAAARLAAGGARRLQGRVQWAVEAGRADARAREQQLRRALAGRPAAPGGGEGPGG